MKLGQRVRILSPVLKGHIGTIRQRTGEGNFVVEVLKWGSSQQFVFSRKELEVIQ